MGRHESPTGKNKNGHHAEARLKGKIDKRATVFVVRVLSSGSLAMARPCPSCVVTLRSRDVSRCYYSVSDAEHGVIVF